MRRRGNRGLEPVPAFEEARPALLRGYHRAFCLYSMRYRGTPEQPGLVLGLDRGGACYAYLASTVDHLDQLGIPDHRLHALLTAVQVRREAQKRT